MRGIAQFLEGVVMLGAVLVRCDDVVGEAESASPFEYPNELTDCLSRPGKVVKRQPAGDQVETGIVEREYLGVAFSGLQIGYASPVGQIGRFDQHLPDQVEGDDVGHVRCEGQRGVTGSCGNVQGLPIALRVYPRHQESQTLTFGVRIAGGVGLGRPAKLCFDLGFRFVGDGGELLGFLFVATSMCRLGIMRAIISPRLVGDNHRPPWKRLSRMNPLWTLCVTDLGRSVGDFSSHVRSLGYIII